MKTTVHEALATIHWDGNVVIGTNASGRTTVTLVRERACPGKSENFKKDMLAFRAALRAAGFGVTKFTWEARQSAYHWQVVRDIAFFGIVEATSVEVAA